MLTTVCSSCHTEFRVTWEQLKVRAGRVRCGKCHTVFNGLAALTRHGDDAPAVAEEVVPVPQIAPVFAPASFIYSEEPAEKSEPDTGISWPSLNIGDIAPPNAVDQVPSPEIEFKPVNVMEAIPAAFEVELNTSQSIEPAPLPVPPPANQPKTDEPRPAPVAETQSGPPGFEFGPKAERKRNPLGLPLAAMLVLLLVGQILFYFRGAIALLLPDAKPIISELCLEFGCEVPLPRRVELVSIETSDLQADPVNPGVMVLMATLRNRAAFPQAFPALELTLTNDRDLPLARRVLQASDYLTDKAEAFDGSSEKQVRLHFEAGALQASGYRLYLFDP